MKSRLENFKTGWVGVAFSLDTLEVSTLIELLTSLKSGQLEHFHFTATDFSAAEGIVDVEFSLKGEDEEDNMSVP